MPPPAPTISISTPTSGATVGRPFPAHGQYTSPYPNPLISVVLLDSSGVQVAAGNPVSVSGGNWSTNLNPPQALSGGTVYAEITGTAANASAGNITVT